MTIVRPVMPLLGHRARALPKRLDRTLPHVDVEGETLRRTLATERARTTPTVLAGVDEPPSGRPRAVTACRPTSPSSSPAPAPAPATRARLPSRCGSRRVIP
ncbi:hypothetical protein ACWDG1_20150 [Streptomyces sp. NPDC001177]